MFYGLVFIQMFPHPSSEQFPKQAGLPWVIRSTLRMSVYFVASADRAPWAIQWKITWFREENIFANSLPLPPHWESCAGVAAPWCVSDVQVLCSPIIESTIPNKFRKKKPAAKNPADAWKQYLKEVQRQKRLIILKYYHTSECPLHIFRTTSVKV